MSETLALTVPSLLLLLVAGGYLLTVFEPYHAIKSEEGRELLEYHRHDPKVHSMAKCWARAIVDPGTPWFDEENPVLVRLYLALVEELVRHRFLTGEDPSVIKSGKKPSALLKRALLAAGLPADSLPDLTMTISPKEVRTTPGGLVWRGRPAPYQSRFCDFYPEP